MKRQFSSSPGFGSPAPICLKWLKRGREHHDQERKHIRKGRVRGRKKMRKSWVAIQEGAAE